jgi:hypothetical protein
MKYYRETFFSPRCESETETQKEPDVKTILLYVSLPVATGTARHITDANYNLAYTLVDVMIMEKH